MIASRLARGQSDRFVRLDWLHARSTHVRHSQVDSEKGRDYDQEHGEDRSCRVDHRSGQSQREDQLVAIEADRLPQRHGVRVLGGNGKNRTLKEGLDRSQEADWKHRPVQQGGMDQVGEQLTLGKRSPVVHDVVKHRCHQEQGRRREHPEWVLKPVAHQGEGEDVNQHVREEERRQGERIGEQNDVQLLEPPQPRLP